MDRTLSHLKEIERNFIDNVYIKKMKFQDCANLLSVDITTIQQLNKDLDDEWRKITPIRDKWESKKIGGNFWDFYYWTKITKECCHYCGITKEELDRLHEIGISNKRTTRGRTLEIDRKIPNEEYGNLENLTYSCYWCNNAKTDTFTEEEFKIIGKAISEIWGKRLNNDN